MCEFQQLLFGFAFARHRICFKYFNELWNHGESIYLNENTSNYKLESIFACCFSWFHLFPLQFFFLFVIPKTVLKCRSNQLNKIYNQSWKMGNRLFSQYLCMYTKRMGYIKINIRHDFHFDYYLRISGMVENSSCKMISVDWKAILIGVGKNTWFNMKIHYGCFVTCQRYLD